MFNVSHLHPMLVHFPIALAMVGLLFEAINLFFHKNEKLKNNCGEWILYLSTLSAVLALLSGLFFTGNFSGDAHSVKETHEAIAITATILLSLTSALYLYRRIRNSQSCTLHIIAFTLYLISALMIGITGYMGGNLVYSYMIGL